MRVKDVMRAVNCELAMNYSETDSTRVPPRKVARNGEPICNDIGAAIPSSIPPPALRYRHIECSTSSEYHEYSCQAIRELRIFVFQPLLTLNGFSPSQEGQYRNFATSFDEFESQLAEGWTRKKKRRVPNAAEAQGSSKVSANIHIREYILVLFPIDDIPWRGDVKPCMDEKDKWISGYDNEMVESLTIRPSHYRTHLFPYLASDITRQPEQFGAIEYT
ncbi:hypothetical protein B0H13DRAFT_2268791 [Mycena leptocephala]|nr:hypothetical protein B0H13DRAFT_2268791 [Mycena leptocephala]